MILMTEALINCSAWRALRPVMPRYRGGRTGDERPFPDLGPAKGSCPPKATAVRDPDRGRRPRRVRRAAGSRADEPRSIPHPTVKARAASASGTRALLREQVPSVTPTRGKESRSEAAWSLDRCLVQSVLPADARRGVAMPWRTRPRPSSSGSHIGGSGERYPGRSIAGTIILTRYGDLPDRITARGIAGAKDGALRHVLDEPTGRMAGPQRQPPWVAPLRSTQAASPRASTADAVHPCTPEAPRRDPDRRAVKPAWPARPGSFRQAAIYV